MALATDPLSRIFFALADPTRRGMLERLATGPATVGELAAPYAMSRPAISQHLAVLDRAGLVERTVQGRWRSCTLRPEPLGEAEEWVARNTAAWQARFDRLDTTLTALTGASDGGSTARNSPTSTTDTPTTSTTTRKGKA